MHWECELITNLYKSSLKFFAMWLMMNSTIRSVAHINNTAQQATRYYTHTNKHTSPPHPMLSQIAAEWFSNSSTAEERVSLSMDCVVPAHLVGSMPEACCGM